MRRRGSSMSRGTRLLILALAFTAGCQTGPAEEACRAVVSRCRVEAPDLGFVGDAQSFRAFSSIPLAGEPRCDGLDETFCGRALGDLFECLERHGVCGPGGACVGTSYNPDVEASDVCCIEVKRLQAFCSPDPEL